MKFLGKAASYGVRMLGVGGAFAHHDMPEYKTQITIKEFAEKGDVKLEDIKALIELESSDLRRGFKKHKYLESVLYKVIDYRIAILKKGFFCSEVENFLYPPKPERKVREYKETEPTI